MSCRQELAAAVAAEGLRPILAPDTPPQLARLLEAAWQLQPEQRPTAAQLEAKLRSIVEHCSSSKTSLGLVHHDQAPNGICIRNSGASHCPVPICLIHTLPATTAGSTTHIPPQDQYESTALKY